EELLHLRLRTPHRVGGQSVAHYAGGTLTAHTRPINGSSLRGGGSHLRREALHHPAMPAAPLGDEIARVEPRAVASDRRDEELSGGGDACHVRVELTELLLRERAPGVVPGAEHLTHLGD